MNGKTPHRFLAKACVEFAYYLGIQDKIENIETLKVHALKGTKLNEIKANEQNRLDIPSYPFHVIQFTEHQFHFHFFMKYTTAIGISWLGKPEEIFMAYDLNSEKLFKCVLEGNELKITNEILRRK